MDVACDYSAYFDGLRRACLTEGDLHPLEFLKSLRASGNSVRFGMVTSEGSMEMRGQAEEAGALFLLTKPFGPDDFKTALSAAGF